MTKWYPDALARAAAAVDSDVRRYAIQRLIQHGSVSGVDLRREFPGLTATSAMQHLRRLQAWGIAACDPTHDRKGNPKDMKGRLSEEFALRFTLQDTSGLAELHQWLGELLGKEKTNA